MQQHFCCRNKSAIYFSLLLCTHNSSSALHGTVACALYFSRIISLISQWGIFTSPHWAMNSHLYFCVIAVEVVSLECCRNSLFVCFFSSARDCEMVHRRIVCTENDACCRYRPGGNWYTNSRMQAKRALRFRYQFFQRFKCFLHVQTFGGARAHPLNTTTTKIEWKQTKKTKIKLIWSGAHLWLPQKKEQITRYKQFPKT